MVKLRRKPGQAIFLQKPLALILQIVFNPALDLPAPIVFGVKAHSKVALGGIDPGDSRSAGKRFGPRQTEEYLHHVTQLYRKFSLKRHAAAADLNAGAEVPVPLVFDLDLSDHRHPHITAE